MKAKEKNHQRSFRQDLHSLLHLPSSPVCPRFTLLPPQHVTEPGCWRPRLSKSNCRVSRAQDHFNSQAPNTWKSPSTDKLPLSGKATLNAALKLYPHTTSVGGLQTQDQCFIRHPGSRKRNHAYQGLRREFSTKSPALVPTVSRAGPEGNILGQLVVGIGSSLFVSYPFH